MYLSRDGRPEEAPSVRTIEAALDVSVTLIDPPHAQPSPTAGPYGASALGKTMITRPPFAALAPISRLPPQASTTRRTTASPMPVPVARVV
jgi:hypothetical protein